MNRNAECMYLRKSKWPQLWSGLCFLLFFTFLPKNLLQAQTIEGPQMVCAGDEVTYVFTGTIDPNLSYEWTVLGGAPVLSTNQMISLVWQIGGLGAVTLEACDDQGNCTNYSIDVEVSDIGMPDIFSSFQPAGGEVGGVCLELECPLEKPDGIFYACSGQAVTYFVADIPDATYEWFVSTGGNIESGQGTSTISAIWSDPGVYALLLDIELNGCTQTLRYCVRVSESPSVQIQAIPEPAGGIVSICPGQMVLFSNDLENVFWDFGDGQFSESQNPSHTYTDPGTYTISLTGFSTCDCPGTNTLTINVIGAEAPNIESTSVECQDASITSYAVTNTLGCDMAKYTWTIQDTDGDGNADGQFLNPPSFPSLDPEVEVVWDFPSTGIGILCVEVENCGAVCTQEVCVEITAILKDAMIEGPEVVCEGELATYTIPIMPGATYNWSVDGGDLQTPANTHTINVEWGLIAPSTGTVSLDLAINSTLNCSPSLDDLEVSILPTPEINGLNTYCEGESPTYSISGNSNPIVWSLFDEAGSLIDQQNGFTYIMAADLATGNYTLMGNALEFCEEASKLINILPIAPVPEIEPFDPVCRDAIATYTANVGDDLLITWEVTGGEILNNASSSTILVDWDASGNYSLSITQEYASGPACPSDPLVVEVPVIADETLSINGPSAVLGECEVQYTTSANAENLNWTIEPPQLATIVAGQGSSTITVQVHQVLSGGSEFTVSLTADICGVTQTTSQEVSILTLETPIITGPSEICQGANATWNVINPNPFPITSYNWIFGNGQTATGPGPINSGAYNEAGTQIVQLLVNYELPGVACVEAVTASKEVVVRRLPLAYVTSPTGYVICINDPLPLTLFATEQTAPTSTGSLCYEWRDQADALVGTGSVLTGITEPGIYTLTVKFKDGDLTCTSGQQITIEEEFCAETCEDYTIEYIAKCSSYRFNLVVPDGQQGPVIWNFGDGTIEGPVSSDEVVFHTYENAGFYFVSARLGDCEVVRSIIVPLVADFTAEVTCNNAGNGYQIDVVSFSEFVPGFPPVIYEYRYMNTLLLSTTNPIASIPTAGLPTGPVEIAMTVVSSYNGRKCTVRQTVDIPEQLEAFFEVDNPSCEGTLLAFENLSTGSITSTQWDFGDGSGSGQPGDVDKVYLGFTDDPFTPMVSLTVNDQYGCSNTYTETLNINQNSLSGFIAVSKNLPACADEGATLTANFTSDAPPINYAWFRAGEEGVIATGPSITVFEAGVYTLQVSDGENCMQELVSPYIALYPAIVPSIEGLGNPCFGDGIFLSTNYSNDGTAIDWSITNPNGTTFTNNNFTITMMGTYMVHVTVEDETTGCTGTASLSFEPNPLPELSIAVDPDPACIPLTLSAVSDCEPNCNYLWSTNQTSSSISIAQGGTYWVTVVDEQGCEAQRLREIDPIPDFSNLMTGYYLFCKDEPSSIPIWSIPPVPGYTYIWYAVGSPDPIATGNEIDFSNFGSGVYYLEIKTSDGCQYSSDFITLDLLEDCDETECKLIIESIKIFCSEEGPNVFDVVVDVTNGGNNLVGLSGFSDGATVNNLSFVPTILPTGLTSTVKFQITDPTQSEVCITLSAWDHVQGKFCQKDICVTIPTCLDPMPCEVDWVVDRVDCFVFLDIIALSLDAFSTEGNFDNLTFSGGSGVNFFFVNPNSLSSGVPTDFILYGSALPGERTVTITGTDTATGIECSWEITFTAPACGGPLLDPCPGVEMNSSQVSCLGYDKDGNPRYQFQTTLKGTDRYRQGYLVPGKTQSENIFEQVVIDPRNGIVSGILKDVAPFNNTLCVRLALSQVEGQFCEVDLCMDSKGNCSEGDRPILNQLGQQTVLDESIQLFPNPAQDQIQIAWNAALLSGPLNLQIQSPEGRSWQMERADARQGQHWMDVSQLSPGLYVLMIREGEVLVAAKRLVIIR